MIIVKKKETRRAQMTERHKKNGETTTVTFDYRVLNSND